MCLKKFLGKHCRWWKDASGNILCLCVLLSTKSHWGDKKTADKNVRAMCGAKIKQYFHHIFKFEVFKLQFHCNRLMADWTISASNWPPTPYYWHNSGRQKHTLFTFCFVAFYLIFKFEYKPDNREKTKCLIENEKAASDDFSTFLWKSEAKNII